MGWQRVHLFEGITLTERTLREEDKLQHPAYGPQANLDEARAERSQEYSPADFTARPTMLTPTARAHSDQPGAGPERSARPEQCLSHSAARVHPTDTRRAPHPDLPDAA